MLFVGFSVVGQFSNQLLQICLSFETLLRQKIDKFRKTKYKRCQLGSFVGARKG